MRRAVAQATIIPRRSLSLMKRGLTTTGRHVQKLARFSAASRSVAPGIRQFSSAAEGQLVPRREDALASPSEGIIDFSSKNVELGNNQGGLILKNDSFTFRILGTETHAVEVELDPGKTVRAETGSFLFMSDGVEMETSTAGGIGKGLTRMMTGENFFMSDFTYKGPEGSKGHVTLGASHPCKIIPVDLSQIGGELICAKGSYICGSPEVKIEMAFTKKLLTGMFGGEGFILQKIVGNDTVLLKGGGVVVMRELAEGETLRVATGCLVAFQNTVHYDFQTVGSMKNAMFGGAGVFMATLTGPGKVIIQALPFAHLVGEIGSRLPLGGGAYPFYMGGTRPGGEKGEGKDGETAGAAGTEGSSATGAATGGKQPGIWGADKEGKSDASSSSPSAADANNPQQNNNNNNTDDWGKFEEEKGTPPDDIGDGADSGIPDVSTGGEGGGKGFSIWDIFGSDE